VLKSNFPFFQQRIFEGKQLKVVREDSKLFSHLSYMGWDDLSSLIHLLPYSEKRSKRLHSLLRNVGIPDLLVVGRLPNDERYIVQGAELIPLLAPYNLNGTCYQERDFVSLTAITTWMGLYQPYLVQREKSYLSMIGKKPNESFTTYCNAKSTNAITSLAIRYTSENPTQPFAFERVRSFGLGFVKSRPRCARRLYNVKFIEEYLDEIIQEVIHSQMDCLELGIEGIRFGNTINSLEVEEKYHDIIIRRNAKRPT